MLELFFHIILVKKSHNHIIFLNEILMTRLLNFKTAVNSLLSAQP